MYAMRAGSQFEVGRFVADSGAASYLQVPVRSGSGKVAMGSGATTGMVLGGQHVGFGLGGSGPLLCSTNSDTIGVTMVHLGGTHAFGWGNSAATHDSSSVKASLYSDATGAITMRGTGNADQAMFWAPEYASSSDYQRGGIQTNTIALTTSSGSTQTTSGLVPAGKYLLGITARVDTAVEGATTFEVGDGTDANRFGAAIAIAAGTTVTDADYTAAGVGFSTSAQEVTLTVNGSDFSAGVVTIVAYYVSMEAD